MSINVSAINEIADTVLAFVPTILIISVVGWVINAFQRGL